MGSTHRVVCCQELHLLKVKESWGGARLTGGDKKEKLVNGVLQFYFSVVTGLLLYSTILVVTSQLTWTKDFRGNLEQAALI